MKNIKLLIAVITLAINSLCYGSNTTPAYFKYFFTIVENGRERIVETSFIEAINKNFSRESLMKFGNKLPFGVKKVAMIVYEYNKTTPTQYNKWGGKITQSNSWSLWNQAWGDFKNEQDEINKYKSALAKHNKNIFAPKPSKFKTSDDQLSAPLLEYLQVPTSDNQTYAKNPKVTPRPTKPLLYIDQRKSPPIAIQELQYLVIDLEQPEEVTIGTLEVNNITKIYINQRETV
jgi:hypothetical protein